MRDGDGAEAAETLHDLDGRAVDECDAVPEDVAVGSAKQDRALSDGKLRLGADPDQAGLVLAKTVEMPVREPLQRGPSLAAGRNELTLILADRADPGAALPRE